MQNEIKTQCKPEIDMPPHRPRALTNGPHKQQRLELSTERIAEKALQWHKSENLITSEKIQENLKRQMEILNSRLQFRKKQSEQKAKIMAFEKGIEEIMEEYMQAKDSLQYDINEKYKEQIEELNQMPKSDLILQVIQETNNQIGREIEENMENIEANKKKKIQSLKAVIKLDL